MIKNYIIIFLIFFFFNNFAFSKNEVVFIDLQLVFNQSNYGKKVQEKLKKINDTNIKIFKKEESEIKKINENIKKIKNIVSEEELEVKVKELNKKIDLFNNKKKTVSLEFNDLRKKELAIFFDKIGVILSDYMTENSISLILEKKNILIGKDNLSITNEILSLVNDKIN